MRRKGEAYVCALCGATLEIALTEKPRVEFASNADGTVRILKLDNRELHRCKVARG